ncbi:MAG: MMPL family transporter [Pseudomonadota bacterium]
MTNIKANSTHLRPYVFYVYRIGLLALAFPKIAAATIAVTSIVCLGFAIAFLEFDGEPSNLFSGESKEYIRFINFEEHFHTYSKDEILLVSSTNLKTVEGMENLRDLYFDIQLMEDIGRVVSIFSVFSYWRHSDDWSSVLPPEFETDEHVRATLENFVKDNPLANSLITENLEHTLIVLSPEPSKRTDERGNARPPELDELISYYQSLGLSIQRAGEPAIERDLIKYVKEDALVLPLAGIFLSMLIATALFRSIQALVVTMCPLVVSLVWYLGAISVLGLTIDAVTVIVPVLVMVLTFADTVHLYLHWRKQIDSGGNAITSLKNSIQMIGSAAALASFTTGIAFLIFFVTSSDILDRMAITGAIGVCVVYLSTIVVCPVSIFFVLKVVSSNGPSKGEALKTAGILGAVLLDARPHLAAKSIFLMIPALLFIHFQIPTQFSLLDYLPTKTAATEANKKIESLFGGSEQLAVLIRRQTSAAEFSSEEYQLLLDFAKITTDVIGSNSILSLSSLYDQKNGYEKALDLSPGDEQLNLRGLHSDDLQHLALIVSVPVSLNAVDFNSKVEALALELRKSFPETSFELTGSSHMRSAIAPRLIEEIRLGLLISILISILIIGLSFRSALISLASVIPNILPILLIEFCIWLFIGKIELSAAIALIIGFGLAVDDTIHFLNHYVYEKYKSVNQLEALKSALLSVAPALVATSSILGLGFSVTFLASLPTVFAFGYLVIGILIFALIADLFVLPSILILMKFIKKP